MEDVIAEPPFRRVGPAEPVLPVLLSVPHAGRLYSPQLLRASRLPLEKLETLEDRLVDRLVWRAVEGGASAIIANRARAEIDLNRHERDIDPATVAPPPPVRSILPSAKARGGLGLIPSKIAGAGSIWFQRTPMDEVRRRIETIHRPYHEAIGDMLERIRSRFGVAILLDCHSMPPRSSGGEGADLIFGDLHGVSMSGHLVDSAIHTAAASGFTCLKNLPYAGGHITARHGNPRDGVHALQLEIDRSLYLDPTLRSPGAGFDRVAQLISEVTQSLAGAALQGETALAAE